MAFPAETIPLLGGRLHWLPTAPRPSEDAFWLAACVPLLPSHTRVLDAGCGNGAAGLALAVRQPQVVLQGLDIQAKRIAEATQHAMLDGIDAQFTTADLLVWPTTQQFGAILCNPPFHTLARGHTTPNATKALAHGLDALAPWVASFYRLLAAEGAIHFILHATLQPELVELVQPLGGTLHTAPLATHASRPAKRLLVRWLPNSGHKFQHLEALLVPAYHTPLREAILREGQGLAACGYGW
jgi:tRNA1(Val) A37 N6-methylase TrmN6